MTVLEKITAWLKTFPLWEDCRLQVDGVGACPGNVGLYLQGLEEVSRREDVLGNVQIVNRLHLMLYRITAGEEDRESEAAWMLELQNWVRQQSAAGLAPRLGDVPAQEKLLAEQGRLKAPSQTGVGRYAVKITAEYVTKIDN